MPDVTTGIALFTRRYVPEPASIAGRAIHEPWKLERASRRA
jgi:hypothetical protein